VSLLRNVFMVVISAGVDDDQFTKAVQKTSSTVTWRPETADDRETAASGPSIDRRRDDFV